MKEKVCRVRVRAYVRSMGYRRLHAEALNDTALFCVALSSTTAVVAGNTDGTPSALSTLFHGCFRFGFPPRP